MRFHARSLPGGVAGVVELVALLDGVERTRRTNQTAVPRSGFHVPSSCSRVHVQGSGLQVLGSVRPSNPEPRTTNIALERRTRTRNVKLGTWNLVAGGSVWESNPAFPQSGE